MAMSEQNAFLLGGGLRSLGGMLLGQRGGSDPYLDYAMQLRTQQAEQAQAAALQKQQQKAYQQMLANLGIGGGAIAQQPNVGAPVTPGGGPTNLVPGQMRQAAGQAPPAGAQSSLSPEQQRYVRALDPVQGNKFLSEFYSKGPAKKQIVKAADGYNYDVATGERVVPHAQKAPPPQEIFQLLEQINSLPPGDPSRKMLEARAAKLTSMGGTSLEVGPDGSVSFRQGAGAGAGDLSFKSLKPGTQKSIENRMEVALDTRMQMANISQSMDPGLLEWASQIETKVNKWKDFAGIASPQEKAQLAKATTMFADVGQFLSETLLRMSGAAVTDQEYKRARAWLPTSEDSPTTFMDKVRRMQSFSNRAVARLHYIRGKGYTIYDVKVEDMPEVMERRGLELEGQMQQQYPDAEMSQIEDMVRERIKVEFGLL